LICLAIANVSRPDRNVLFAKHSSQFLVQQDLPLERLVILVFSATEDDHAELGIGSDSSEKFLVRTSVKVRQLIEVDRGWSVIFPQRLDKGLASNRWIREDSALRRRRYQESR
jgi:hypothetical protein